MRIRYDPGEKLDREEKWSVTVFSLDDLVGQVLRNCSISDARYAGYYSVCGLALRLRDLYKWEKGLAPWMEEEPSIVLDWIGQREEAWEGLAEKEVSEITIDGRTYEAFDTAAINRVLEPHGIFYGAGYVYSLKPTFFLAPVEQKTAFSGHPVFILGHEFARDLVTLPALAQDASVVIRRESGEHFLWNQILYVKESGRSALKFALEAHGVRAQNTGELQRNLALIFSAETNAYIHHELGELKDDVFDREVWRELIAAFPHTPVELLVRTVKDLLADTNEHGTLPYAVRERKRASIGFYVAFLDGFRKMLFPEMVEAFQTFSLAGEWNVVEEAVAAGRGTVERYAQALRSTFLRGKEMDDMGYVEKEIENKILEPLVMGGRKVSS